MTRFVGPWITVFVVALTLGLVEKDSVFAQEAKKLAVPDKAAQDKAESLVKDLFKDDYTATTPAQLAALANKLQKESTQVKGDVALRFVLLREARDLAVRAGETARAIQLVDELAAQFTVDAYEMKAKAITEASVAADTVAGNKAAAELALIVVNQALDEDNYPAADQLLKVAEYASRKTKSVAIIDAVAQKTKEVAERRAGFEKVKEAIDTLAKDPKDAKANLIVGRYECLVRGNFAKGLPLLAQCDEPGWKELASRDLVGMRASGAEQASIADTWWAMAEKSEGTAKDRLHSRAISWYLVALPRLTGNARTKALDILQKVAKDYLSDLKETDEKQGYGKFGKNGRTDTGAPISVGGIPSPKGIYLHPPNRGACYVKYRLGKEYKYFIASAGINDTGSARQETPLVFQILLDDKPVWTSPPLKGKVAVPVMVDVSNAEVMELRVHCAGSYAHAHAVWLEPLVIKK